MWSTAASLGGTVDRDGQQVVPSAARPAGGASSSVVAYSVDAVRARQTACASQVGAVSANALSENVMTLLRAGILDATNRRPGAAACVLSWADSRRCRVCSVL